MTHSLSSAFVSLLSCGCACGRAMELHMECAPRRLPCPPMRPSFTSLLSLCTLCVPQSRCGLQLPLAVEDLPRTLTHTTHPNPLRSLARSLRCHFFFVNKHVLLARNYCLHSRGTHDKACRTPLTAEAQWRPDVCCHDPSASSTATSRSRVCLHPAALVLSSVTTSVSTTLKKQRRSQYATLPTHWFARTLYHATGHACLARFFTACRTHGRWQSGLLKYQTYRPCG